MGWRLNPLWFPAAPWGYEHAASSYNSKLVVASNKPIPIPATSAPSGRSVSENRPARWITTACLRGLSNRKVRLDLTNLRVGKVKRLLSLAEHFPFVG